MFLTTSSSCNYPEPDNNDNPGMGARHDVKRPINTVISTFEMFNGHNLVVEILNNPFETFSMSLLNFGKRLFMSW